jgi:mono/diheme cytochrome c family protein
MRWKAIILGGLLCAAVLTANQFWAGSATAQEKQDALLKRGDYLVNSVGRCGDCHTPRNGKGEFDKSKHLQGAPIWFTSKIKFKPWDEKAPDITMSGKAGKWTEERLVKFFTTGEQAHMPMPAYKLTPEDAKAVTAYLRSLPGAKKTEE